MIREITEIIEIVAVLGTAASLGYYFVCLWCAVGFLRDRSAESTAAGEGPFGLGSGQARATRSGFPVSILKPLRGTDPEMYESFRSHCLQEYPEYEIIFGVNDATDPAVALVERLKAEFPQRAIRLVVCSQSLGTNTKVSNLAQMLPLARYEYLLVNDGDIRVEPDYLRRVMAPLADPSVGMVTCLYRGLAGPTLGSKLESVGISTDFVGGVLAARQLEGGIRFGLGSTLAFHRRDLEGIGGFEALLDYLADDYEMGSRIAALGKEVRLSDVVVETFLPAYTFREFLDHQLRWSRSVRDSRRWGFVGLVLTFGLCWTLLALASAHGASWVWGLLGLVLATRLVVALVMGRLVLQDHQVMRLLYLIVPRDLVALLVWVGSFGGHTVVWRGDSFTLKDGKLLRLGPLKAANTGDLAKS